MNSNKNKPINYKTTISGYVYQIDLARVLLRPSMVKYINTNHTDLDLQGYKTQTVGEVGSLTRMEYQNSLSDFDFAELLEVEPVKVISKMMEVVNPETGETEVESFYEIENGRHRITSAIVRGLKTINADVVFSAY